MNHLQFLIKCAALVAIFSLENCRPPASKPRLEVGFYYWKTHFEASETEKTYARALSMKKLYLRFFDITHQYGVAQPVAEIRNLKSAFTEFGSTARLVPTIFITHETFIQTPASGLDSLCIRVWEKISAQFLALNIPLTACPEIQFDCDWTARSRAAYFQFITQMKRISGKEISVTLRLHQVRDRVAMGIPPADRAMLMLYNMGNLSDPETKNSILDLSILSTYLKNFEGYAYSLDFAFPLFSWGVVQRDGAVVGLLNNLEAAELETPDIERFLDKKSENQFEFLENTYFRGQYFYANDVIRLEKTAVENLSAAAEFLSQKILPKLGRNSGKASSENAQNFENEYITICFFHLDARVLKPYKYEDLAKILEKLH
jgi:hypothetical protein